MSTSCDSWYTKDMQNNQIILFLFYNYYIFIYTLFVSIIFKMTYEFITMLSIKLFLMQTFCVYIRHYFYCFICKQQRQW